MQQSMGVREVFSHERALTWRSTIQMVVATKVRVMLRSHTSKLALQSLSYEYLIHFTLRKSVD